MVIRLDTFLKKEHKNITIIKESQVGVEVTIELCVLLVRSTST